MDIKNNSKHQYYLFQFLFVFLNILATFIITTEAFNRYIIAFDYTLVGIVNSIIGNAFILLGILFLVIAIVKKPKNRIITLLVITFILNAGLFAINVFNRYYGTAFTFKALAIFKNPGDGFGMSLVWEALRELVTYYRIILFIPFISLILYYYAIKYKGLKELEETGVTIQRVVSRTLILLVMFFINLAFFTSRAQYLEIVDSAKAAYATQNMGLYNYLFLDSLGFDYKTNTLDIDEVKGNLDYYNKNKESYINFMDNKVYTKSPNKEDINNISGPLVENIAYNDNLTGILKDYNLVLVHLETFNNFLLQVPEISKHFKNLNALREQSYVFNNFYTNVGLGNSFDAELAVLTGLMPNGTSTIAWDYNSEIDSKNFDFNTLPKMFNSNNYVTNSLHGNSEGFYNRNIVHPDLFGFDYYKGKETVLEETGLTIKEIQDIYEHEANHWISDRGMLDIMNQDISNQLDNNELFMKFLITMMPHTPYLHDPFHNENLETYDLYDMYDEEYANLLDTTTLKYLNYAKYYDDIFRVMFEDVNGYGSDYVYKEDSLYNFKKTAYVFYGDHGSGIKHNDLSYLYNKELNTLESRMELLKTTAFIYVPGDNIVSKEYSDGTVVNYREGLLKGEQNLVRGQLDLHRTIVDLFGLPIQDNDYLFGVHGMSTEPTYSLDNKTLDVVTDTFFGTIRNSRLILSLTNEPIDFDELDRIKKEITNFKQYSDIAMNQNLYKEFKKRRR